MFKKDAVKHVFQISYDTEETEGHTIDAEKLGDAIVSMSKALKNANKVINGEGADLGLDVKAHSEGSFVVEFVTYLNNAGINPLSILGFMGVTGTAVTVLGALKELKSRKITLIQPTTKGMSTVKLSDDSEMNIPSEIAELIASKSFRDNIDTIIKAPLEGTTNAKFIVKDDEGTETFEITEEDAESFTTISQNVVEEIKEDTERKEVYFTKVNFEGTSGWQIKLPDDSLVAVTMKDEAFIERVNKNNQEFSKTALFSVKLKTITKHRHGTSPTYKRELLEVIRKRAE
ncbi:hypothetical protein [Shewanella sp. ENK2]|uniref:hypothetical protein n=1 Tax=Shewanella sp. ENK2 TaxID=2775245 RepID=UPI00374A6098